MQTLSGALAITCLLLIGYQDFKSRSVQWIYFPLLASAAAVFSVSTLNSLKNVLTNTSYNIAFFLIQLGLLKTYFWVTRWRSTPVFDEMIGWGDILFMVSISCLFSPVGFIAFYLSSLLFALLVSLVRHSGRPGFKYSIPLAGLQALFLIPFLFLALIFKHPVANDHWILEKIIRL